MSLLGFALFDYSKGVYSQEDFPSRVECLRPRLELLWTSKTSI